MKSSNTIQFIYRFEFENGEVKQFCVEIDSESMTTLKKPSDNAPKWTELSNFKCDHCPLDESLNSHCPLALNLADVIKEFQYYNSFDKVKVTAETPNRTYYKETELQSGVSSYLGILMVTSGCPIMSKLKPLLYFHLPFATLEETEVRVFSLYLLAQVIKLRRGENPDWEMNNLFNIYEDIKKLNRNVSKKIADLESKDASINSLIVLNNFADYVTFALDEKIIDELTIYLKEFL